MKQGRRQGGVGWKVAVPAGIAREGLVEKLCRGRKRVDTRGSLEKK